MIEHVDVNGRPATVIYLTDAFEPAEPDAATRVKVIYDNGEVVFGRLALEASSVLARVEFANPYHEPKGTKKGGQFAHKNKGPMAAMQNARSLAAMKSYVPITASGLRTSKGNERALTAFLIGRGTMAWNSSDSEPIDIAVRSGRKWVGVELKSRLTATAHKRVNMSPPKRRRKEDWGAHPKSRRWGKEWPKMPLVTVAWDTVENTFYIEQHVGAFWYKGMKKHKTMASLRRAILKAAR